MAETLQEITLRRTELAAERRDCEAAYETACAAHASELKTLAEREALLVAGLDLKLIDAGRAVVRVQGSVLDVQHGADDRRDYVRARALHDAKERIAAGGAELQNRYIGVKNYAHFGDQRADCSYGSSPRHGTIVFAIRLTPEAISRLKDGDGLSEEEINAALYLLTSLPKIEAAQKQDTP